MRAQSPGALAVGAFEALRRLAVRAVPENGRRQRHTRVLPVKHPSRMQRPDNSCGPGERHTGFGWDAAHHAWFSGFRLGLRTDRVSRRVVNRLHLTCHGARPVLGLLTRIAASIPAHTLLRLQVA